MKRRISVKDFAERAGVSGSTIARLEKGDDGVGIGTLAMACLVLGEIDRISDFLDAGSDDTGLLLDRDALPKRIGRKRTAIRTAEKKGQKQPLPAIDDEEGVGF